MLAWLAPPLPGPPFLSRRRTGLPRPRALAIRVLPGWNAGTRYWLLWETQRPRCLARTECRRPRHRRRQVRARNPFVDRMSLPRAARCRRIRLHRRYHRASQELHRVRNDIDCLALVPILRSHSRHSRRPSIATGRPLRGIGGILALCAPHRDVEIVGLVLPFAGAPVLAARVAATRRLHTEFPLGRERSSGLRSGFRSARPC